MNKEKKAEKIYDLICNKVKVHRTIWITNRGETVEEIVKVL